MEDNKVLEFPQDVSEEEIGILEASFKALTEAMPELEGVEGVAGVLALPDDQFSILAPILLTELEKSLNNVSDKLILTQGLTAAGIKSEDLLTSYNEIVTQLDEQLTSITKDKRDFVKQMLGMLCNAIAETEGLAKRIIQVPIELCDERAKMPTYAHDTDAGADIYALEDVTIHPGETKLIKTGLKVAIPLGYEIQVRPKSGRCLKTKMRVANSPGTIDSGYRDEIGVIIDNIEPPIASIDYDFDEAGQIVIKSILHGKDFTISAGEKFAQLVFCEVPRAAYYQIDDVKEFKGDRGGGFGSTDGNNNAK